MNTRSLIRSSLVAALVLAGTNGLFAQVLTVTADLQLWLKANAGVTLNGSGGAAQWDDQSGNANHAVQATDSLAPTVVPGALNGLPVLRFDGVDDSLSVADSLSLSFAGDLTTFFVVRFDDFDDLRAVWAKTVVNYPAPTDYYILPGSGLPRVLRGDGGQINVAAFDSTIPLTAGSYLTVGFGMEGSVCTHYIASQPASSGTIAVAAASAGTPLMIGNRADGVTRMKGDIAEILIYSRALTPVERASVASYLGTKYGIANLLPTASMNVTPAGPTHAAGDTVTLDVTASDPDGSIASVQFFANGTLLGTASAPPYKIRAKLETAGDYTFTARATDNRNGTTDSAGVIRTVTAGAPPALDVLSTLQLWLKADAGVTTLFDGEVVGWADQSGNLNDAIQGDLNLSPILTDNVVNGKPVLHFDGVDDYLSVADSASLSITTDVTSFFVVRMDDFATFRAVWGKTVGNLPAATDFYTVPGSGNPQLYRGNGTPVGLASLLGSSALHAGAFDLVGFSATASTLSHFLNGSPNGTGGGTASAADGDTALLIGTRADLVVTKLKGDLAELLIYNTALSVDDLHSVQVYLAAKYGLPLATPVNDPPTVVLTAPAPGGSGVAPVDVFISANAGDADGSVVKVEFLVNGGVAATDLTPAYSATVNFAVASTATIRARATDNLGAVTLSAPVTFTVTAAQPLPLPAAANLRLWLRADKGVTAVAGVVSAWDDQSGNFNNTTQPTGSRRPTLVAGAINGQPALRFDGIDDSLVAVSSPTLAITGDISTFFVVKFTDFATYRAVWAKTQGNLPASTDFYALPNNGRIRAYRGNGTANSLGFVDSSQPIIAGAFAIVGFDHAGTTLHHYLNGELNGVGQITATLADTGAPLYIGTRGDITVTHMKGDIAEVIIYDSALSDADRGIVFSYLGNRYGIATTPLLSIVNSGGGTFTVSWPANVTGWVLEFAMNVQGPWDLATGVVNNSLTDFMGQKGFYRLRKL